MLRLHRDEMIAGIRRGLAAGYDYGLMAIALNSKDVECPYGDLWTGPRVAALVACDDAEKALAKAGQKEG